MFQHHSHTPPDPQWLPPRAIFLADFNFLVKQFPAARFEGDERDESLLIFSARNPLIGQREQKTQGVYFKHTIFIEKAGEAAQLELGDDVDTDVTYFRVPCKHTTGEFSLVVERDFDTVSITDLSGRTPTRTFTQMLDGVAQIQHMQFSPLPAFPRVLLHHPELGYFCFAFERFGAYPKIEGLALGQCGIRGFRQVDGLWSEFEVGSTILAGRGLHNLSFETEIGSFFVPGPASLGPATYTPPNGRDVELRDFDPEDLKDPLSPGFDTNAYMALRSLGMPALWPPAHLL